MEKSDEQKSIGDPHHMDQLERRASETQKATGSKACHFSYHFPFTEMYRQSRDPCFARLRPPLGF